MSNKGKKFEVKGEHLTVAEIAVKYNLSASTVQYRVNRGERGEELIAKVKTVDSMETAEARQRVIASRFFIGGEYFTSVDIATVLRIPTKRAGTILSDMAKDGLIRKREGRVTVNVEYSKPCTDILRKAWRTKTDSQCGIRA